MYISMCVCICVYVCMYPCVYVLTYICIHVSQDHGLKFFKILRKGQRSKCKWALEPWHKESSLLLLSTLFIRVINKFIYGNIIGVIIKYFIVTIYRYKSFSTKKNLDKNWLILRWLIDSCLLHYCQTYNSIETLTRHKQDSVCFLLSSLISRWNW